MPWRARGGDDPPRARGSTHYALGEEITAAVKALRERFPEHVDFEGPLSAGFSQGAIMGALLIAGHPQASSVPS